MKQYAGSGYAVQHVDGKGSVLMNKQTGRVLFGLCETSCQIAFDADGIANATVKFVCMEPDA